MDRVAWHPARPVAEPPAGVAELAPAAASTGWHQQLKDLLADKGKLTDVCRKGLDKGVEFLDAVGPMLPVPGPSVVKVLATVLEHCSKALANKDNLTRLVERCTDLLGLLAEQLEPAATGAHAQAYRNIMGRFNDTLKGVERYCRKYTKKAWWLRVISSAADQEEYNGFVNSLTQLTVDATFGAVTDTRSISVDIRQKMDQLATELTTQMAYTVSPELEQKFEQMMDMLRAIMDKGHHQLITQPEMRAFWCKCANGQEKLSWHTWWCYFPKFMGEWLTDDEHQQLCHLLADGDDDAKSRFQAAMERHDPQDISVDEVMRCFPADMELVPRVQQLLDGAAAVMHTPAAAAAAAAAAVPFTPAAAADQPLVLGGSEPAKCELPALDPLYCGREAAAQQVCSLLQSSTSPVRAVLLLGAGGLGKSSLAVDVGRQLWQEQQLLGGAVMVNLRGAATQQQQLQRICMALDVSYGDDALPRLLAKLRTVPPAHHLLLVLDNAEDCLVGAPAATFTQLVAQVLRSSPAVRLLITSRVAWPTASSASPSVDHASEPPKADAVAVLPEYQEYEVPPLDCAPESALAQLLRQLCPEDVLPPTQLQPVLDACCGSPLLTRLVADALTNGRLVAEDVMACSASQPADSAAVRLVLTSLRKQQLQQLARLTVFPYSFDEEDAGAILGCLSSQAQTLLHVLHAHSLLLHDSMREQHYLHTAVKQQAAVLAANQLQQAREAFIHLMLARLMDWAAMYQTKDWALALRLLRQQAANVDELWRLVSECDLQQGTMQQVAAAMSNALRLLLLAGHKFTAAKAAWHRLQQWTFSEEALHANALTFAAWADGLHSKAAESKLRTALEVRQRVLGREDPDTVSGINHLASCLQAMGQHAAAEPMYHTALEVGQRVMGPAHPDTITSVNGRASCLQAMGQNTAAEPLYRSALEVRQRVLGQEHPDTITSINNLASCLQAMGQYTAAGPMYCSALEVRQRVLGPEHPDTIISINNLASFHKAMGQYAAAEHFFSSALEVRRRVLGPEHPDTITSINNLASCLQAMGQHAAAEPMFRAALEVRQRVLGPEHPDTIGSINNLAGCLQAMGQYAAAEHLFRSALEVRQRVLGPEHPNTITSLNNLATCLSKMGQYAAAEPMFRTALEVRRHVLGLEHPSTISSINKLARCLQAMGQYAAAEPLFRTALAVRQRVLGPEHPDTITSSNNLASCLQAMGQ